MLPKWNQEEWLAIVATIQADSVWVASAAKSMNYVMGTTNALPTTTSSAGAFPSYIAMDKKGKVHIAYSCSS